MPDGAGLVLAFDFGTRRIGVAIGETLIGQARPLGTVREEANAARFAAIEKWIREWQPVQLVVGLPLNVDGSEHEMSARARRFSRQLAARFGLPVALVDERYSSLEAEAQLKQQRGDWMETKDKVDAAAAQVILQSYFDELPR